MADSAGRPFEGAFVTALPSRTSGTAGDLQPMKPHHAVTTRDGRATLLALPPGPWTVSVHGRGFVTRWFQGVASGSLAVTLEKGGVVTGRVVASDGGRPLAGARVVAAADQPPSTDWPEDATHNVARTDVQGRFRLEGIGRSPTTLTAHAPGRASGQRGAVRAGDRIDIVLFPGSTLRGTVRDPSGRPVNGALVRAEADRSWGQEPSPERTDALGRFQMAGVTAGEYMVVARDGGRAPAFARVVVEPEAEANVTLMLSDGAFVTGRVVTGQGRPLRGRVRVEAIDDLSLSTSMSNLLATESGNDGTFALGPLPLGGLSLAASAPRHATRRLPAQLGVPGGTVDLGEVALEAGLLIQGQVHDGEGRPLAGAILNARSETATGPPLLEAIADADGAFAIEGLEAGLHLVTATASGHARATVRARAGGEPLEIALQAAGEIAGHVVDARGRPVRSGLVRAKAREGQGFEAPPPQSGAEPADGAFRLEGLAAGAYDLEARASGHGTAVQANVVVVAGRTTQVGTLTLNPGGTVTGRVVDREGQGIAGATVYVEIDPRRLTEGLRSETDPTGAFEIRGVPAGRVLVRALHPSFTPGGVPEVPVDLAKDSEPLRIVLGRGARVEGRVRHRDGRPFTNGRVIVHSSDASAAYGWPEPLPLDADGAFVAEHIPPGRARVHVLAFATGATPFSSGAFTTLSEIAAEPVDLNEGETAGVDVTLRDVVVSGRVTRGGQAASAVRVRVSSGSGRSISFAGLAGAPPTSIPPALVAATGADGGYELLVFMPGPARVGLAAVASGHEFPSRDVIIPDVDFFCLDLEIGEAMISGVVIDVDTGAPLADVSLRLTKVDGSGQPGASGRSGADGRFGMGVETGTHVLAAELPGRVRVVRPLSIGPGGLADVRIEMGRGLAIVGRAVGAASRPAAGQVVVAIGSDGLERATVRTDGSFASRAWAPARMR